MRPFHTVAAPGSPSPGCRVGGRWVPGACQSALHVHCSITDRVSEDGKNEAWCLAPDAVADRAWGSCVGCQEVDQSWGTCYTQRLELSVQRNGADVQAPGVTAVPRPSREHNKPSVQEPGGAFAGEAARAVLQFCPNVQGRKGPLKAARGRPLDTCTQAYREQGVPSPAAPAEG